MTIIGAMDCGDSYVLASDSIAIGRRLSAQAPNQDKIWPVPGLQVAWGASGDTGVALDLKAWVDEHAPTFGDWEALRAQATQRLAELNRERRRGAELAGANQHTDIQATDALFVGYINHERRMLYLDAFGGSRFTTDSPTFIGSAQLYAEVAYWTASALSIPMTAESLRLFVHTVARHVLGLGLPVQLCVVTPAGALPTVQWIPPRSALEYGHGQ